ncbi:hypothetical protein [Streptomyces sp. NPDC058382]|uniref:hypothetical protein n=1 Tax=unclassified Streptomyces TaxID=2593676 RepID=UPI00363D1F7F
MPEQLGTGTLTLTLSNAITTALTTTGPTSNVIIDRAGQNAQHTFQAAAGDDLSLGLTSNPFTLLAFVTVFTPSGVKVVNSQSLSPGYATHDSFARSA